jgi:hypothetical protein
LNKIHQANSVISAILVETVLILLYHAGTAHIYADNSSRDIRKTTACNTPLTSLSAEKYQKTK